MARYIAFDWGKARTGIAVSDCNGIIATPHSTVTSDELNTVVDKLYNEEPCAGFVVGVPGLIIGLNTDSSEGIEKFIKDLQDKFPSTPIHKVDEAQTSWQLLSCDCGVINTSL